MSFGGAFPPPLLLFEGQKEMAKAFPSLNFPRLAAGKKWLPVRQLACKEICRYDGNSMGISMGVAQNHVSVPRVGLAMGAMGSYEMGIANGPQEPIGFIVAWVYPRMGYTRNCHIMSSS